MIPLRRLRALLHPAPPLDLNPQSLTDPDTGQSLVSDDGVVWWRVKP